MRSEDKREPCGPGAFLLPLHLGEEPEDDGSRHLVLLAVDQQLGEGRDSPGSSTTLGALEVGEHEDVEQLGAGSGAERVQALPESALEFIGS
jgi:hypothetical protein